MQARSLKLTGSPEAAESLRKALLNEPSAAAFKVTELIKEPTAPTGDARVRDLTEHLLTFAIHIPAGIAAHTAYDWLRAWLRSRTEQVRNEDIPPPPAH